MTVFCFHEIEIESEIRIDSMAFGLIVISSNDFCFSPLLALSFTKCDTKSTAFYGLQHREAIDSTLCMYV